MKSIRVDFSDGVLLHAPDYRELEEGQKKHHFKELDKTVPRYVRWMKLCGEYLKSNTSLSTDRHEYSLAALPTGYILLERTRAPGLTKRPKTDVFLYGHPGGSKFRSPREFMPHLLWLVADKTHKRSNCPCKLCLTRAERKTLLDSIRQAAKLRKSKRIYSGMSLYAKAQLEHANNELARDMQPNAPIYRIGEIVLCDGIACIVADHSGGQPCSSFREARLQHRYLLFKVKAPHHEFADVSTWRIKPYLTRSRRKDQISDVVKSVSPVAKFNIQGKAHSDSGLPGPSYIAWFLGPEKIYHRDLVRLNDPHKEKIWEFMQLSHIVLDVASKTLKARGDLFELSDVEAQRKEDRKFPELLSLFARKANRQIRYVNPPGDEIEVPLANILGRFYHPDEFPFEHLEAVSAWEIVRGRVSVLPAELICKVESAFNESKKSGQDCRGEARQGDTEIIDLSYPSDASHDEMDSLIADYQMKTNVKNESAAQKSIACKVFQSTMSFAEVPHLDEQTLFSPPSTPSSGSDDELNSPAIDQYLKPKNQVSVSSAMKSAQKPTMYNPFATAMAMKAERKLDHKSNRVTPTVLKRKADVATHSPVLKRPMLKAPRS